MTIQKIIATAKYSFNTTSEGLTEERYNLDFVEGHVYIAQIVSSPAFVTFEEDDSNPHFNAPYYFISVYDNDRDEWIPDSVKFFSYESFERYFEADRI